MTPENAKAVIPLLVLVLAGCVKQPSTEAREPSHRLGGALNTAVDRIMDPENGVACYVTKLSDISCVKVSEVSTEDTPNGK